jgi:hypothetical protein
MKHYKEPMSLSQIMGVLHTGFYRRAIFMYWEGHKYWRSPIGYGASSSEGTIRSALIASDKITEDFILLPSISARSGGSNSDILNEQFNKIESAEVYAEYVAENIDILTIKKG